MSTEPINIHGGGQGVNGGEEQKYYLVREDILPPAMKTALARTPGQGNVSSVKAVQEVDLAAALYKNRDESGRL